MHARVYYGVGVKVRTTFRSQFSSSTLWALGGPTHGERLGNKCLYPLSCLPPHVLRGAFRQERNAPGLQFQELSRVADGLSQARPE